MNQRISQRKKKTKKEKNVDLQVKQNKKQKTI